MKKIIRCIAMLLTLAMLLPLWPQALAAERPGEVGTVYLPETSPVAAPMADPKPLDDYPIPEDGYDTEVDGFHFRVGSDYAVLTEYTGSRAVVEIPATVDGVPVVRIGANVFRSHCEITGLYLPEGLKYIDTCAFEDCGRLRHLMLPASLMGLGDWAFSTCHNLSIVYIPPESVLDCKYGEESAFDGVMILGFPGTAAEEYAKTFHKFFMPMVENRQYVLYGNGVYSTAGEGILRLDKYMVNTIDFITIPDSISGMPVTEICGFAFASVFANNNIPCVRAGYNVKTIRANAFAPYIPSYLFLPESVTEIEHPILPEEASPEFYGFADTAAQRYAQEHGYSFNVQQKIPFTDVKEDAWYYEDVRYAHRMGLMRGVSDTEFRPEGTTTRAMMMQVLFNIAGDRDFPLIQYFEDVNGQWFTFAVNWAAYWGIAKGITKTTFGPDRPVTREQAVTFLYRFSTLLGLDTTPRASLEGFMDHGKVSEYAQEAMSWAVAVGLLKGMENNTLQPQGNSTRAQLAALLTRYMKLFFA